MPQRINKEKSDLSVSLGSKLRKELVVACAEDEKSLSQAVKEAVGNWLAARERKRKRKAADGQEERS
jgi:hypothetical protein